MAFFHRSKRPRRCLASVPKDRQLCRAVPILGNQYFRELLLADVIAARAAKVKDLVVIIIVPGKLDEESDPITEHGNALQYRFFARLDAALGSQRLRRLLDGGPVHPFETDHRG